MYEILNLQDRKRNAYIYQIDFAKLLKLVHFAIAKPLQTGFAICTQGIQPTFSLCHFTLNLMNDFKSPKAKLAEVKKIIGCNIQVDLNPNKVPMYYHNNGRYNVHIVNFLWNFCLSGNAEWMNDFQRRPRVDSNLFLLVRKRQMIVTILKQFHARLHSHTSYICKA